MQYIEQREARNSTASFPEECRRFLKAYEVGYDERYMWD